MTGGAQGIGWAVTRLLARAGAHVYVADICERNLHEARQRLAGCPGGDRIRLARVDVTDQDQVRDWTTQAVQDHGRIDVLVNNAAFVRWQDFHESNSQDALLMMRTGYDAMVHTVAAVLPYLREQRGGHIVNMGSSLSRVRAKGPAAAYVATKAAVEAFTEVTRLELADHGIRVTLVRPGLVAGTDFFRRHVPSDRLPRFADHLPPCTPEQVAAAIGRALAKGTDTVDIPAWLPLSYGLHQMSPRAFRRLAALGGPARRDFGHPHAPRPRRSGMPQPSPTSRTTT
ncbi:SDR family oxidoreductase [Streptomyces sp. NBC_00536]|uniref:SDR family NAD(P)-dependent oxidoreductase n=1 Tax=Streptomyces sp. NBC_00536 TaxID=2975769 RepID=UPI002E8059C3|nr:SDR family oxidoreductase [Streptomyces sp. NBC_00536]WUC77525.1 SDR family oxidoreductase [Streptomyces sp. NBC_00536]